MMMIRDSTNKFYRRPLYHGLIKKRADFVLLISEKCVLELLQEIFMNQHKTVYTGMRNAFQKGAQFNYYSRAKFEKLLINRLVYSLWTIY